MTPIDPMPPDRPVPVDPPEPPLPDPPPPPRRANPPAPPPPAPPPIGPNPDPGGSAAGRPGAAATGSVPAGYGERRRAGKSGPRPLLPTPETPGPTNPQAPDLPLDGP